VLVGSVFSSEVGLLGGWGVEVLEEGGFIFVLLFLVGGEALIALYHSFGDGGNMVENLCAPDVSLLDVVETFVASTHELIDLLRVTNFVALSPVVRQLQLSLGGVSVPSQTIQVNNERHVPAVLSEESHTLEVSFDNGSRLG